LLNQLSAWLSEMAAAYPNLAQLISIGKTAENRDIWLIKVILITQGEKMILFSSYF
jgi:hypothetical protein